jgi:glucan 1,3-beta-glucosidase
MADLVFRGGNFGFYGGNQQFTVRNLKFYNCNTAIQLIWDWGWAWKNLDISGGTTGINLVGEGGARNTGSVLLTDSKFSNVPVAIKTSPYREGSGNGNTIITLDNVDFSQNVRVAVQDANGGTRLAGNQKVQAWVEGKIFDQATPNGQFQSGSPAALMRSPVPMLMGGPNGGFFERSKPQYENNPVSDFVNVKDRGARGDGRSDDTAAINNILSQNIGKIIFFPHGVYIVTDTIRVCLRLSSRTMLHK